VGNVPGLVDGPSHGHQYDIDTVIIDERGLASEPGPRCDSMDISDAELLFLLILGHAFPP
jgi:hypothetical protein